VRWHGCIAATSTLPEGVAMEFSMAAMMAVSAMPFFFADGRDSRRPVATAAAGLLHEPLHLTAGASSSAGGPAPIAGHGHAPCVILGMDFSYGDSRSCWNSSVSPRRDSLESYDPAAPTMTGSRKVNTLPSPGELSTTISPPWRCAIA
jgi:hypothetical protein